MSDKEEYDKPISELPEEERLKCFVEWHKLSSEFFQDQRKRETEDLEWQDPDNRWDEASKKARAGRPLFSISLIDGPLRHVYNQAAAAHFGVDLKPVNEKANNKLAEAKKGMFSRIQRDGNAQQARMWAFDRMSQCGRGWYRINTAWDEDSENPSDQEIVYERILYQENVLPDPAATRPDFSDGRFLITGAYVPCRDFHRQYPKAEKYNKADFAFLAEKMPEWVNKNGDDLDPLVVEVFYKESVYETVKLEAASGPYERKRERVQVRRAVCTGCEILEDEPWLADKRTGLGRQYIPFVPMIGVEQQPVDGKRSWVGMVRGSRQGQRVFDYATCQMVEDVSASSKAKYFVYEDQIEGYEHLWNEINLTPRAHIPLKAKSFADGSPMPPPQLIQVDGTKMALSLQLAQQARELVQTATQGYEPLEVPRRKAEQSGRAILALEQKADAGRSHYIQNVKDITLPLDARIVLDMMPVVYDRPGRVIHILGEEDETRPIMIGKRFVVQDGVPTPVPDGSQEGEFIDFSEGKYAIVPVMGKAPQTRLQEGQEFMAQIITSAPEMMLGMAGDLAFKFRDEPGAKGMSERFRKHIRQTAPWLLEGEESQEEQTQAELQMLKAKFQEVSQAAQQMFNELKTEKEKQKATILKSQMETESREKIAAEANETKLLIEGMRLERERMEAVLERANKVQISREDQAHDYAMAAAGAQTFNVKREGGQEQGQEQESEQGFGRSSETGQESKKEPQQASE